MGLFRSYFHNKESGRKEGRGSLPRAENKMSTEKSGKQCCVSFIKYVVFVKDSDLPAGIGRTWRGGYMRKYYGSTEVKMQKHFFSQHLGKVAVTPGTGMAYVRKREMMTNSPLFFSDRVARLSKHWVL